MVDDRSMGAVRTRLIVAVGVLLIVSAGAGSLLVSRDTSVASTSDTSPFPVGHVFTNAEWTRVKTSLAARGFDGSAARVLSGLRLERNDAHFDFGPERTAFETIWHRANYDMLTTILADLPVHWRFFVKTKIFQAMARLSAAGQPSVKQALDAVKAAYPGIPSAAYDEGNVT